MNSLFILNRKEPADVPVHIPVKQ